MPHKCKEVRRAYMKAYYQANREKIEAYREANKKKLAVRAKAWGIAYREANKEKIAVRKKAYHQANKEKIAVKKKAYYQANKEKMDAKSKAYKEANKEKIAVKKKAYNEANKEKITAYYQANKEKYAVLQARRRAAKLKQIPKQVRDCPTEKKRLRQIYKLRDIFTKATGVQHHVDHMWPLSKKGPHWSGNLQIITAIKNMRKSAKLNKDIKATIREMLKDIKDAY